LNNKIQERKVRNENERWKRKNTTLNSKTKRGTKIYKEGEIAN
jgi:hypothetical protein